MNPTRAAQVWSVLGAAVALAALAAASGPWATTGSRTRSSFALVAVVRDAGVLPDRWATLAPLWYAVPILVGGVVLSAGLVRHRTQGVLMATLGAIVGVGGLQVVRSPLGVEPGAVAGVVLGIVLVALAPIPFARSSRGRQP